MSTLTPNYDLIKPGVNDPTDQDLWGGYLNDDLDIIDTVMKENADLAGGATNAQSSNYAVLATDRNKTILMDATGGNRTITLLAAATATDGFYIAFKKVDSSTNTVTIDGSGSETIDDALNYVLESEFDTVGIVCNGTEWNILFEKRANDGYIQTVTALDNAVSTFTTQIPVDDSIPQNTEGGEIITVTITPTDADSILLIKAHINVSFSGPGQSQGCMALFQDSTASALTVSPFASPDNDVINYASVFYKMTAGTTSATTFKIRAGFGAAGTVTVNGSLGARLYGGASRSYIEVMEVAQ